MKMRKVLSALLVAACTLSLAACGSSSSKSETTGASGETAAGSANTAKVIDVDLTSEEYAFGVDKTQPELLEQTNTFIQKIKDDGTLDAICAKYFGDGEPEAVESAELDSSKDQLVVATNAAFEPFEYTKGDQYYGINLHPHIQQLKFQLFPYWHLPIQPKPHSWLFLPLRIRIYQLQDCLRRFCHLKSESSP